MASVGFLLLLLILLTCIVSSFHEIIGFRVASAADTAVTIAIVSLAILSRCVDFIENAKLPSVKIGQNRTIFLRSVFLTVAFSVNPIWTQCLTTGTAAAAFGAAVAASAIRNKTLPCYYMYMNGTVFQ